MLKIKNLLDLQKVHLINFKQMSVTSFVANFKRDVLPKTISLLHWSTIEQNIFFHINEINPFKLVLNLLRKNNFSSKNAKKQ